MARSRPAMSDELDTRARVIQAAVDCILDEGFYRASSNRIAKRAGVTWGVIQYHFGTREALLVEVFKTSRQDLLTTLQDAAITGDTFEERLASLADVIWGFYREPKFVAYEQVTLNLTHDPNTADETIAAMAEVNVVIAKVLNDLVKQVVGGDEDAAAVLPADSLLQILRGVAIGLALYDAVPTGAGTARRAGHEPHRDVLLAALSALVNSHRGESK